MNIPPVKSFAGEFLKAALKREGRTQRDFANSEPRLGESHFSKIVKGEKRQIRPETIDIILRKLPEDERKGFIEAYTLDQLTDEAYHGYVTGHVREPVAHYRADPFDRLAATLRQIFPAPERAGISKMAEALFRAIANSRDLRVAVDALTKLHSKE